MTWWKRPTSSSGTDDTETPDPSPSRRSVYEDRIPDEPAPERWTPVVEIDPFTGRIVRANPDWSREVGGWAPLDDFLQARD